MLEIDPLARLRLFPGSISEQVIALTDLWKGRSKRTFVTMRDRINELGALETPLEPAAFDNYFRRSNRDKTPEEVVWALIRVMRDDTWLPKEQQCTLAEALYLAALKNVSVITYARIYQLFTGQEEEFKVLCPLGDLITEKTHQIQLEAVQVKQIQEAAAGSENRLHLERTNMATDPLSTRTGWRSLVLRCILFLLSTAFILWTVVTFVGVA